MQKSFIHAIVLKWKQTMMLALRSYSWYRWNSSICSVRGFLHRLSCSPTKDKYLSIDLIPWLFYPPICPGKQSLRCIIRAHIKKIKQEYHSNAPILNGKLISERCSVLYICIISGWPGYTMGSNHIEGCVLSVWGYKY